MKQICKKYEKIEFTDLKSEAKYFIQPIINNINGIFDKAIYLFGEHTEKLEQTLSQDCGKKFGVSVKNATDAISLVLKDIYRDGMKIILPNFGAYPTAVATLNVVKNEFLYYVDVDRTMTIDFKKLPKNIKNGIVIFVSLFGNVGNIEEVFQYAKANNHILIVDAAQSTSSGVEKYGDYVIYSFYPTKPLSSCGDGGLILSDNDLSNIKKLRFYGINKETGQIEISGGVNSRMDEIQASIINAKFPKYKKLINKKRIICENFLEIIKGIDWKNGSVFHQFPILFHNRQEVINIMNSLEIPYMIHYPNHVTDFKEMKGFYNDVGYRVNNNIISIPSHPFLNSNHLGKIRDFLKIVSKYEIK